MKSILALTVLFSILTGSVGALADMPGMPMPSPGMPGMPTTGETPEYCADTAKQICAHLHVGQGFNTTDEGKFIAHVEVPQNTPIQNFKLGLWMEMDGMGHPSAPVDIQAITPANHFSISNAWFVMAGTWLVQIDFDYNGQGYHIEIPVEVAK